MMQKRRSEERITETPAREERERERAGAGFRASQLLERINTQYLHICGVKKTKQTNKTCWKKYYHVKKPKHPYLP